MQSDLTVEQISLIIKRDLLLGQLGLGEPNMTADDLPDDTGLLGEGLAIDSVDALDLLVSVEKTFGFKIPTIDNSFIEATCATIGTLANYVHGRITQAGLAPVA
jgi:acyl carrier protein